MSFSSTVMPSPRQKGVEPTFSRSSTNGRGTDELHTRLYTPVAC
jgi:hypothetical protein